MEHGSALEPRNTHGHRLLKYISCLMWTSTLCQAPAHAYTPPAAATAGQRDVATSAKTKHPTLLTSAPPAARSHHAATYLTSLLELVKRVKGKENQNEGSRGGKLRAPTAPANLSAPQPALHPPHASHGAASPQQFWISAQIGFRTGGRSQAASRMLLPYPSHNISSLK